MPEGYKGWAQKKDHLSAEEIVRIVAAAAEIGFRKIRITGGEPLLRPDLESIATAIWELPGIETLGLSTNGTRLKHRAATLRQSGIRSLNVSLDALNPELYRKITGGRIEDVLEGLDAAQQQGFEVIKLNCVLMRGVNENELLPLTHFAAERDMPIRFIELMPLSKSEVLDDSRFLPVAEAVRLLSADAPLEPLTHFRPGHGPARYFRHPATRAKVGFIGALTTPHFCESCNKLRLTADGKLRPCLGQHGELDLRPALRNGTPLRNELLEAIRQKPENHLLSDCYQPGRPMTAIGG
jgi:cyclic pyranopterin phosphate synthase